MSKRIRGKTHTGQELWVLAPNLSVHSFIKNRTKVTFLEIFYDFAQRLFPGKKKLTKLEEEKYFELSRRTLVELDNKVVAIKYLSTLCQKQGNLLIAKGDSKKKVYDYKPYQVFLTLAESYLDTVHSTRDCIFEIDRLLGKTFAKKLESEQWFQIDMDIRNTFHHNQSPLVTVEKGKIVFTFERLPRRPRYLKKSHANPFGRYECYFDFDELGKDIVTFLNTWAKKYLDLLDDNETIDTISGFHKDGRYKTKKVTLDHLKKIAQIT